MFQLVEFESGQETSFPLDLVAPGNEDKMRAMVYAPNLGPVLISAREDFVHIPCFIPEGMLERCKREFIGCARREAEILNLKYKDRKDSLVICKKDDKYGIACLSLDSLGKLN